MMEIVFIILLILVVGALNVACFFIGAKVGQMTSKGEDIKVPTIDPMKPIREHQARKEAKREQDRFDTIMENIENYDGTNRGQKEVPRGRMNG